MTFRHSGSHMCMVWLRCEPQIRRKRVAQTQQAVEWFDAGLMYLTASEHKESVCGVNSLGAFGIFGERESLSTYADPGQQNSR